MTRAADSLVPILTNCISTIPLKNNRQPSFWQAVNDEQRTKGWLSDERGRMLRIIHGTCVAVITSTVEGLIGMLFFFFFRCKRCQQISSLTLISSSLRPSEQYPAPKLGVYWQKKTNKDRPVCSQVCLAPNRRHTPAHRSGSLLSHGRGKTAVLAWCDVTGF